MVYLTFFPSLAGIKKDRRARFCFYFITNVKKFVLPEMVVIKGHVTQSLGSDWSAGVAVMLKIKCPMIPSLEIRFSYSLFLDQQ